MATNVRKKGNGIAAACLKSEDPLLRRDAGIITQHGEAHNHSLQQSAASEPCEAPSESHMITPAMREAQKRSAQEMDDESMCTVRGR